MTCCWFTTVNSLSSVNPWLRGRRSRRLSQAQHKGKKVIVFKYRPKQRYRVKNGHRQNLTRLRIDTIEM